MPKYKSLNLTVPADDREKINNYLLDLIERGELGTITPEAIFNTYTGYGALHGLDFSDFGSYYEFSEAKKAAEQGQFFTPAAIAERMSSLLDLKANETIADITCGHGVFANYFPEENFYGCEIDHRAHNVASFLFPNANISLSDVRHYAPKVKFNYIIGNPPFNLTWYGNKGSIKSQTYCFEKAAELLRPGGIVLFIIPASFCNDIFFCKSEINNLEKHYNFLFQIELNNNAFKSIGVQNFATKVIAFQKKSQHLPDRPYELKFSTWEEAAAICREQIAAARKLLVKLNVENKAGDSDFVYQVKKYLYEIRTHKELHKDLQPAVELVDAYNTQECPAGMSYDKWVKEERISEADVLRRLKRIVRKQGRKNIDKVELVKCNYGFKLKAYSGKAKRTLNNQRTYWSFNDLILFSSCKKALPDLPKGFRKLLDRKEKSFLLHSTPFDKVKVTPGAERYLNAFRFMSKGGEQRFNDIQKYDIGRMIRKHYGILGWQQGSGKTPAGYAWSIYSGQRKTFVVSTAMSVNMTWAKFLDLNGQPFVNVRKLSDLDRINDVHFVLISHDFMIKYERFIKRVVKNYAQKVTLILDESDEITNHRSKRTRAVKNCFRKARRKLLTTGTTTRNNIGELYSQLELLYNNSINFLCECVYAYELDRESGQIDEYTNSSVDKPFPAYHGNSLFKACFNPGKATVFGIEKQDQNVYNEVHLRDLISKTIITRKFKEIAGQKYGIENIAVTQNKNEYEVYLTILKEFYSIVNIYYSRDPNSRKESMLMIIRQLKLLIDATSTPQLFHNYGSKEHPNKAKAIYKQLRKLSNKKVAIGSITKKAVSWYSVQLKKKFPDRPVFTITGDDNFKKRQKIIDDFQASGNGILVCTQQSLKSSVNIPECDDVFIESLQWNIPKIEQFYFRFIRYDSTGHTNVYFFNYHDTIEANLLALLMAKEKLNDYIKTLEFQVDSKIYQEFDIDMDILSSLITKVRDDEGHVKVKWGQQTVC